MKCGLFEQKAPFLPKRKLKITKKKPEDYKTQKYGVHVQEVIEKYFFSVRIPKKKRR